MSHYLLAIDAGTGSIRAIIFDQDGNQIALSQREWHHLPQEGVKDSMAFDYQTNWKLTTLCIQEALQSANLKGEDILAVSSSSMREGIVLYDKEGDELWGVANVDARASKEVAYLKEHFPHIEEEFYALSGQTFALGALPRLLWLKNHQPDLYEKVAKISMISDWILAKLSGIIATDPSNGGTTGIFSLQERSWLPKMAQEVGLKEDIFPPVLEPGTYMGDVTSKAAKECGLSTKTKVVMGGGDVQLGALGLGVVEVGEVAVLGGSFWQQIVNIPNTTPPPSDLSIRINPHVIHNQSQAEGITFFSGLVMRWFRDAFCDKEREVAKERGIDTYTLLEQMAQNVPVGSYEVMPIFSDTMKYGKWYHAAPSFINLSLDPTRSNKAVLFRALEENAAIVSALNLAKIEQFTDIEIKEIVFAGGASKGALWSQILADVTGCIVKIPKVTEATALGTAIAAGVGAGLYESLQSQAKKLVKWQTIYHPNKEHTHYYRQFAKKWQKVYEKQLALVDEGLTTSMWKAPGL